jgi:hypothetical protein
MKTIKSYTDLQQSKKLAKILPIESADMYYMEASYNIYTVGVLQRMERDMLLKQAEYYGMLPCWSLAVLMNMLPSKFTEKGKYSETSYKIDIRKYALTEDTDIYQIAYGNYKFHEDGNNSWKDIISTSEKENLIDVAFEMICWLKENNKL